MIDQRSPEAMSPVARKNGKTLEITHFRIRTLECDTPHHTLFGVHGEIEDTPPRVPFDPIGSSVRRMARRVLFIKAKTFSHGEERPPDGIGQNLRILFCATTDSRNHCIPLPIESSVAVKQLAMLVSFIAFRSITPPRSHIDGITITPHRQGWTQN
jgi:hypothetical protein